MPTNSQILSDADYNSNTYACEDLVIGTGAGGSVAGALLSEAGRNVIMLEEGGYFPTESFNPNVGDMTAKLYRNRGIFPILGSPVIALGEGSCVGGGTVINGAGIFRTPKWFVDEWQNKLGLKGYAYNDLIPHFETIEKDLHIVQEKIADDTNLDSVKLIEAAQKVGWRTEAVPRAAKNCINENLCSTGCMAGAKQSTLVTYIPRALNQQARLFTQLRAIKILHQNQHAHKIMAQTSSGKKIHIQFKRLFLAGGTIQTPHLLRRSGMSTLAGKNFRFHINVKVIARLKDKVYPEISSMFPVQIHEFDQENMYINTSMVKRQYLAMSLAQHGQAAVNRAIENYENMLILNTTIAAESIAHIQSGWGKDPIVTYNFDNHDLERIKLSLYRMSQLLFKMDVHEVFLPIKNAASLTSEESCKNIITKCQKEALDLVTVHIMASCPMGTDPKSSVIDTNGQPWGFRNVWITDASVLPSNIGQSPQGTVMAFAHEIMRRHISSST